MDTTKLILTAAIAATAWHGNQTRKHTGEPYITHPLAVAEAVRHMGGSPEAIAAAILHDVLEDTRATTSDLLFQFGVPVTRIVIELTDHHPAGSGGNRAARKAMERDRLAKASPMAQLVKLADIVDNAQSIIRHDPQFAPVFIAEADALVLAMVMSGKLDPALAYSHIGSLWNPTLPDGSRLRAA